MTIQAGQRIVAPEVVHEDDRIRVTTLVLGELDRTPTHTHERDELIVTIAGSSVRSRAPDGTLRMEYPVEAGQVIFLEAGGPEHYLENSGVGRAVFVAVELKRPSGK